VVPKYELSPALSDHEAPNGPLAEVFSRTLPDSAQICMKRAADPEIDYSRTAWGLWTAVDSSRAHLAAAQ